MDCLSETQGAQLDLGYKSTYTEDRVDALQEKAILHTYCPSKTTSTVNLSSRRKDVHFKTDTNYDSTEIVEARSAARRRKRRKHGDDKKRETDFEKKKYGHFLKTATRYGGTDFKGICEDIGAFVNYSGVKQYRAHCSHTNSLFHQAPSDHILKFGGNRFKSLGMATVRAPINDFAFIEFGCDVVEVDVPMVLGLPVLNHNGVYIKNITSKMVHHYLGWEVTVTYKHGHLFYCWDPGRDVLFTMAELHKLHAYAVLSPIRQEFIQHSPTRWSLWYIDRGLYGYYGYSRINVGHVWALEHCVATGILATTDYTCTTPD